MWMYVWWIHAIVWLSRIKYLELDGEILKQYNGRLLLWFLLASSINNYLTNINQARNQTNVASVILTFFGKTSDKEKPLWCNGLYNLLLEVFFCGYQFKYIFARKEFINLNWVYLKKSALNSLGWEGNF